MTKTKDWKVLVTDGDALHSLAIVRSLGSKKMRVTISSHRKVFSLSFYSKFCQKRLVYPDPDKKKGQFIHFLIQELKSSDYDILLPVRSTVTPLVAQYKEELSRYTNFVIPSRESMEIANNKEKTFKFSEKIGIPIPRTFYPQNMDELEQAAKELSFPVVVKASYGAGSRGVFYVKTAENLFSFFNKYFSSGKYSEDNRTMVQELIQGPGCGFFSIFDKGEPKAIFMHKRIREYPITGGPSTVAESYYHPRLKELGLKILKELNWDGVAMVEFKLDQKDNEFKLMEINPKFWGSLYLAIASGVDFPYLYCLQAMKERFEPVFEYKKDVKFRWLFPGDFMCLLAHYGFLKDFYTDFFDKNVRYDISFADIKPNILEIFLIAGYLIQNKGKIRYPQGKLLLRKDTV
jgi:predicted ATP-grasp superfamily ATP-dependent carboligase